MSRNARHHIRPRKSLSATESADALLQHVFLIHGFDPDNRGGQKHVVAQHDVEQPQRRVRVPASAEGILPGPRKRAT